MTTLRIIYHQLFLITFFLLFFVLIGQSQNTIYVNLNATGANDGSSWNDAFLDLQDAIDFANTGDAIWVAEGTYLPTVAFDADNSGATTNQEQTFYINKNIQLYGQFNGSETMLSQRSKVNQTILSGDIGSPQISTDNAFHVIYIDGTSSNGSINNSTVLDGFIIEQGAATATTFPNNSGAGVFNNGSGIGNESSPMFQNITFRSNSANHQGGALYNNASQGGVSNLTINSSNLHLNTAAYGGAIYYNVENGSSNLTMSNSNCVENDGTIAGGALYTFTDGGTVNIEFSNSYFSKNLATMGSVFYNNIDNSSSTLGNLHLLANNSIFENNLATQSGSVFYTSNSNNGTYTATIQNNTFKKNRATGSGGIAFVNSINSSCNQSFSDNTFTENLADSSGGIFFNTISNNSVFSLQANNNKFTSNAAIFKGGIASTDNINSTADLSFIDNIFESPSSRLGALVYNKVTNNAVLNHRFEENLVIFSNVNAIAITGLNGGVFFQESTLQSILNFASIKNNYINNSVSNRGGVAFNNADSSTLNTAYINDVFNGCQASNGGALYHTGNHNGILTARIINCTFFNNEASNYGHALYTEALNNSTNTTNISNSIFWQTNITTGVFQINTLTAPTTLDYSIYYDGNINNILTLPTGVSGNNNLDIDPNFTNSAFGDLTLDSTSPAIDAASNDSIPPFFGTDNANAPRIYNNTIDMGAYEFSNSIVEGPINFSQAAACSGDTGAIGAVFLGGTPPYSINGVSLQVPISQMFVTAGGTYQFVIVDANGLTDTAYVTLTQPTPITLSTIASTTTGTAAVNVSGGTLPYSYQWNDANNQSTDIATGLSNGIYTVTVTDANGCVEVATVTINVITSYKKIGSNSEIIIAPNPSSGHVQVTFNLEEETDIQPVLYNLQGQIVHQFPNQSGQQIIYTENLSKLPAGTYLLKTTIKNKHVTQQLVLVN